MNAVILNQRTVKLDSFDPNLLTALAQKARYLGGKFRTSLLPKKRVATLTFSTLPSVSLSEIVNEVTNPGMNSTPPNISEQSLPNNTSSESAEAIAYGIAPLTATTPSTATPAPLNGVIALDPKTLDPLDAAKPSTTTPKENTLASLADLLSQRKTKLKKLAQYHKIPGRSAMSHEEKAEALVGLVLAHDL